MIKDILKEAYEKKSIIGITTKIIDWDESIIGFIIEIDDTYFTLNELDEYGAFIGSTIISISDVCHVEPSNWYMRNLLLVMEGNSTLNPNARVTVWKEGKELKAQFQHIKDNNKITRFFFEDDNFAIGIVLDFDKESLLIKNIGQDGSDDGVTCYQIDDIIGLRYDGLEEQRIRLLLDSKEL